MTAEDLIRETVLALLTVALCVTAWVGLALAVW